MLKNEEIVMSRTMEGGEKVKRQKTAEDGGSGNRDNRGWVIGTTGNQGARTI